MLFECKQAGTPLDVNHASQLYRYFSVTTARIAVLTNGVLYRFFTDLEEPNKMDSKPFMEFNMLDIQEPLVTELRRLSKGAFNLDEMISVAGELKYTREIKRIMAEQLTAPADEFVRFFASQVYSGRLTQAMREQFAEITKRALAQFISERINERLRSAMADTSELPPTTEVPPPAREAAGASIASEPTIVTTPEELEAFYIIKSILRQVVEPGRIVQRDMQSYFGVLLDNNNRKPICRLHFNRKQRFIGFFNADKQEERVPIGGVDEIYSYADRLKATALSYGQKNEH